MDKSHRNSYSYQSIKHVLETLYSDAYLTNVTTKNVDVGYVYRKVKDLCVECGNEFPSKDTVERYCRDVIKLKKEAKVLKVSVPAWVRFLNWFIK